MIPTHAGSFRIFRFAGIDVFLHWSWFVVAFLMISWRRGYYDSVAWNIAEYLVIFVIVLLHEFGHALACRQVGGEANEIVLWPLGGVAYVAPPLRPGATLWSIAAGPLVNVVLIPVLLGLLWLDRTQGWSVQMPEIGAFLMFVAYINAALLMFNLLPVYPLDGGQILRSVLWFFIGRGRSLMVSTIVGFVGVAGLIVFALMRQSIWLGVIALFMGQRCLAGYRQAQALNTLARAPRHQGFACPTCHNAPPGGPIALCGHCRNPFDPFSTRAVCPHCQNVNTFVRCLHCGSDHAINDWVAPPALHQR